MTTSYIPGELMTKEHAKGAFYSSYEDKYIVMDNLGSTDTTVEANDEIYNADYVYVTVVTEGNLNITVGGTDVVVSTNGYLAVTPCMRVKVKESNCRYFCFLTKNYLMTDIYEHSKIGDKVPVRAFCYRHYQLDQELIDRIYAMYSRIKAEHLRGAYPMKEQVLRAMQTAYIAQLFSFLQVDSYLREDKKTRQFVFFNEFVELLGKYHKEKRTVNFYAEAMHITPKYLSSITQACSSLSASQVIDQYVIYSVKQALYSNHANIKTISAQYNFPSQSFFGRYFKRVTGLSPNEYIKNHNRRSLCFDTTSSKG